MLRCVQPGPRNGLLTSPAPVLTRRTPVRSTEMRARAALVAAALVASACGTGGSEPLSRHGGDAVAAPPPRPLVPPPSIGRPPPPVDEAVEGEGASAGAPRPDWLGRRPLPLRPDGFGEVRPTPPELDPRHLATPDIAPPPPGGAFVATVEPVAEEVFARSTWEPGCPVDRGDLRHVRLSFWGFDERPHTGELLLHAEVTAAVVEAFGRLFEARFPIEEMRITRTDELHVPPTGDGNNTGAFVCRAVSGGSSWSQHAYGRAVDINPFHNPYVRGGLVVPELASAYVDRGDVRPGMIVPGGVVEQAFDAIGWGWGGRWSSVKDWMHFSATGR